jgi:hypothetical protein
MVAPKLSFATRKEMKVPKKPLASWMALVAMTSIPICVRIDPSGRIALHRHDARAVHCMSDRVAAAIGMVARLGAINVPERRDLYPKSLRSTIESWVAAMNLSANAFCCGMPGAMDALLACLDESSEDYKSSVW